MSDGIRIIAAYAGTGKTTLAAKYPDTMIDFVCMPYKYYLAPDGDSSEAGKANPFNELRKDWPYNYFEAIKSALRKGDHHSRHCCILPQPNIVQVMMCSFHY